MTPEDIQPIEQVRGMDEFSRSLNCAHWVSSPVGAGERRCSQRGLIINGWIPNVAAVRAFGSPKSNPPFRAGPYGSTVA